MKIILYAKSSDGINYYEVTFKNLDGVISIKCNCRAGELNKLCRHKLDFIRGDDALLYDNSQNSEFITIKEWISTSPYANLIKNHDNIEKVLHEKQKELKKIKGTIEISMNKGI